MLNVSFSWNLGDSFLEALITGSVKGITGNALKVVQTIKIYANPTYNKTSTRASLFCAHIYTHIHSLCLSQLLEHILAVAPKPNEFTYNEIQNPDRLLQWRLTASVADY